MAKNVLLLQANNKELSAKIDSLNNTIDATKQTNEDLQVIAVFSWYMEQTFFCILLKCVRKIIFDHVVQEHSKKVRNEMEERMKDLSHQTESKHKKLVEEHNKKLKSLQLKVSGLHVVCNAIILLKTRDF